MNDYNIDDDFLYKHMRIVENKMLDSLPKEELLSHEFSKGYKRKMKKLLKMQRRSSFTNHLIKLTKSIAVIFIVTISIILASVMSTEAYRVYFFEKIIEIYNEFTGIVFHSEDSKSSDEELVPVNLNYIPTGFKKTEEELYPYEYYIYLENEAGIEIMFEQVPISTNAFVLDTEDTTIESMVIEEQDINYFVNKGLYQFYWNDNRYIYTVMSDYNKDELIKIIENILKKNK